MRKKLFFPILQSSFAILNQFSNDLKNLKTFLFAPVQFVKLDEEKRHRQKCFSRIVR